MRRIRRRMETSMLIITVLKLKLTVVLVFWSDDVMMAGGCCDNTKIF